MNEVIKEFNVSELYKRWIIEETGTSFGKSLKDGFFDWLNTNYKIVEKSQKFVINIENNTGGLHL